MSDARRLRNIIAEFESSLREDLDTFPIAVDDIPIYEDRRKFAEMKEYIESNFPADLNGDSIINFGCNTGTFLLQLKRNHNAGPCFGYDKDPTAVLIANEAARAQGLSEIAFYADHIPDIDFSKVDFRVDHVLITSLGNSSHNKYKGTDLVFDTLISTAKKIARKSIYIEFTQSMGNNKEAQRTHYDNHLKRWGDPEFLDYADHEERLLYRINLEQ